MLINNQRRLLEAKGPTQITKPGARNFVFNCAVFLTQLVLSFQIPFWEIVEKVPAYEDVDRE